MFEMCSKSKNAVKINKFKKVIFSIYAKSIDRLRQKVQTAPFKPNEVLVKHVEFAAQFDDGLPELDLPGANLSLHTYFGLDIIALAIILLLFGGWFVAKTVKSAIGICQQVSEQTFPIKLFTKKHLE